MRRRRHKLEVSTFPFLAVLLCAMGSLILLLLVIDRRAKAVARAKALAVAERLEAEDAQAVAARAAELERRREALHAVLENQARDLRGRADAIRSQERAAAQKFNAERQRMQELSARIRAESGRITQRKALLSTRRAEAAQQQQKLSDAAKIEMARLAAELGQLEQTLADLKALRQRETQMFSVVPYRGKQGDSRKPIYVECTDSGLIFHPDRTVIAELSSSGKEIRDEVERRINYLRAAGDKSARDSETAYLLLLVRPTGVQVYYHTLAALSGLKIDFGYEFVESDWVLDFPSGDGALRTQPWMTAQQNDTPGAPRPTTGAVTPKGVARGNLHGVDFHGQMAAGLSGGGATGGTSESGPASASTGAAGGSGSGGPRAPPDFGPGGGYRPGSPGGTGTGFAAVGTTPAASGGRPGVPGGWEIPGEQRAVVAGYQPGRSGGTGLYPASGGPVSGPGRGFSGSGDAPGSQSGAPAGAPMGVYGGGIGSGSGSGTFSGGVPGGGSAGTPSGGSPMPGSPAGGAPGGGTPGGGSAPFTGGSPGGGIAGASAGGNGVAGAGQPGGAAGAEATAGGNPQPSSGANQAVSAVVGPNSPGRPGPRTGSAGSGNGSSGGSRAGGFPGSGGEGGEPGDGSGRGPLASLMQPAAKKKPRPVPVRRRPLNLNRDWHIPLLCQADGVTILVTQQHFTLEEVARSRDNPLLAALRQMIDRRQARVPPGEPPYRPLIRFQVTADGLRAYYLAYPVLDLLNVPMMREDLDPENEARAARPSR